MIDMVPSWRPPADHDAARRERPRRRTAEQRDELATLQLIKLHPIPHRAGTARGRISKPEGSVSGYRAAAIDPHIAAGSQERVVTCVKNIPGS
jgi:hypothetical protein